MPVVEGSEAVLLFGFQSALAYGNLSASDIESWSFSTGEDRQNLLFFEGTVPLITPSKSASNAFVIGAGESVS